MDQVQNSNPQVSMVSNHKLLYKMLAMLVAGLVIGFLVGYLVMKQSVNKLQDQITALQAELKQKNISSEKSAISTSVPRPTTLSFYRARFSVPTEYGSGRNAEVLVPLGSTGSYVVRSMLVTFEKNSNIKILSATDSVVYENFIRNGTQAITPDPNTLAPGNPNSIRGVNFCANLAAKSCVYDEKNNTAVFEKEYKYPQNNPYTVWGVAKFFDVSENDIGKQAAILIARLSINDQLLIDQAKEIIVNAKFGY